MRAQKHDTFSKEFREEAVRQAREERQPLTSTGSGPGREIQHAAVVGEASRGGRERAPGRERDLVDENRRLRAENHQLRLEREILKKATAFFAKHSK